MGSVKRNNSVKQKSGIIAFRKQLHTLSSGGASFLVNVSADSGMQSRSRSPTMNYDCVASKPVYQEVIVASEKTPECDGPPMLENMKETASFAYPEHLEQPVLAPELLASGQHSICSTLKESEASRVFPGLGLFVKPKRKAPRRRKSKPLDVTNVSLHQSQLFQSISYSASPLPARVHSNVLIKRGPGSPKRSINRGPKGSANKQLSGLAVHRNKGVIQNKPFEVTAAQLLRQTPLIRRHKRGRPPRSKNKIGDKVTIRQHLLSSSNRVFFSSNKGIPYSHDIFACSSDIQKSFVAALARNSTGESLKECETLGNLKAKVNGEFFKRGPVVKFKKASVDWVIERKNLTRIEADKVKRKRERSRNMCVSGLSTTLSSSSFKNPYSTISPFNGNIKYDRTKNNGFSVVANSGAHQTAVKLSESFSFGPPDLSLDESQGLKWENVERSELDSRIYFSSEYEVRNRSCIGSRLTPMDVGNFEFSPSVPNVQGPGLSRTKLGQNRKSSVQSTSQVGFNLGCGRCPLMNLPLITLPFSLLPSSKLLSGNMHVEVPEEQQILDLAHGLQQQLSSSVIRMPSASIGSHSSPCVTNLKFDKQSINCRMCKHSKAKHFKSKHKNIVDPVFLADMAKLISNISALVIHENDGNKSPGVVITSSSQLTLSSQNTIYQLTAQFLPSNEEVISTKSDSRDEVASCQLSGHWIAKESIQRGCKIKAPPVEDCLLDHCGNAASTEQRLPLNKHCKLLAGAPTKPNKRRRPGQFCNNTLPIPDAMVEQVTKQVNTKCHGHIETVGNSAENLSSRFPDQIVHNMDIMEPLPKLQNLGNWPWEPISDALTKSAKNDTIRKKLLFEKLCTSNNAHAGVSLISMTSGKSSDKHGDNTDLGPPKLEMNVPLYHPFQSSRMTQTVSSLSFFTGMVSYCGKPKCEIGIQAEPESELISEPKHKRSHTVRQSTTKYVDVGIQVKPEDSLVVMSGEGIASKTLFQSSKFNTASPWLKCGLPKPPKQQNTIIAKSSKCHGSQSSSFPLHKHGSISATTSCCLSLATSSPISSHQNLSVGLLPCKKHLKPMTVCGSPDTAVLSSPSTLSAPESQFDFQLARSSEHSHTCLYSPKASQSQCCDTDLPYLYSLVAASEPGKTYINAGTMVEISSPEKAESADMSQNTCVELVDAGVVEDSDKDVIIIEEDEGEHTICGQCTMLRHQSHKYRETQTKKIKICKCYVHTDKIMGNLGRSTDKKNQKRGRPRNQEIPPPPLSVQEIQESCTLVKEPTLEDVNGYRAYNLSDCEPLPLVKKKRKCVADDMGYTKPRRKRQKQKRSEEYGFIAELETSDDGSFLTNDTEQIVSSQAFNKHFLRAGLFSTTFKEDNPGLRKKRDRTLQQDLKSNNIGLLPAPVHVGKYMYQERVDFTLPFDMYWMHFHNMLSVVPAVPKFRKIRNNVYVDARPVCGYETHPCNCKPLSNSSEKSCGNYCLNRNLYTECDPGACPCGQGCSNQRIQKHEWAEGLHKITTVDRGVGVSATKKIEMGQFIVEYIGEVVSEQEFRRRMTEEYQHDQHHYCLNLGSGMVIDGYRMGNISRFINHSCQPNCEMQKWNVNGVYRIALFSLLDIAAETELTYDYNFHSYNLETQQICKCGSENCRGVVGGRGQKGTVQIKEKTARITSGLSLQGCKGKVKGKSKLKQKTSEDMRSQQSTPVKPMSFREQCFAQKHAIFLLRNITKTRLMRRHNVLSTEKMTGDENMKESGTVCLQS